MSLALDLIAYLKTSTTLTGIVSDRFHQNHVPQTYQGPYVWLKRRSSDDDSEVLDQLSSKNQFREFFDVEVIAQTIEDNEQAVDALKELGYHRGAIGSGRVQGLFVRDQEDDYVPQGANSDEGYHVAANELEIVGYQGG